MKIINLLPKVRQQEVRYDAIFYSVQTVAIMSVMSFALVFLCQFGVRFYITGQTASLQEEINTLKTQVEKKENGDVKAKVKTANDLILDYKNLIDASPKWSKVIKAFASLPPDGIKVNSLNIDPVLKRITINGFSPTRELTIQLYNIILNDKKDFNGIDYPIENVAKPDNVSFHFSFNINDDLLK